MWCITSSPRRRDCHPSQVVSAPTRPALLWPETGPTTVVYAAMALVATLPGAVVLLATTLRRRHGEPQSEPDGLEVEPVSSAGRLGGEVTAVRR